MDMRTLILSLFLVCIFSGTNGQLENITQTAIGTAGGNTIWYQSDSNEYLSWGNIKNPVKVSIIYNSGSKISNSTVCVNSYARSFPISGVHLNSTCPYGAVGVVTNQTQMILPSSSSLKSIEASDNSTVGPAEITASLYVKPTTQGGFIVAIPENNVTQKFQILLNGEQCSDPTTYPVGQGDNICIPIESIQQNEQRSIVVPAGSWQYFKLDTTAFNNSTNIIYAFRNQSDSINLYTQSGYYPTESWYIPTIDETNDNIVKSTILTPGTFGAGEIYFFGLYNSGDSNEDITFNITTSPCNSFSVFGYQCNHGTSENTDAETGVFVISATLSSPNATNATTNNVGSAFIFDYDDNSYENDYAYFAIDELPDYDTPYYIRVSVANTDVTDSDGAPALYAKKGGYPSAQSNHYNISTIGDVTHQMVIQIDEDNLKNQNQSTETWYFAVPLPAEFAFWVGSNCAGNCDNQAFGICMCDSRSCENSTSGFSNPSAFYRRPESLLDSAGACSCTDDDYDSSYNCSEVNYPYFWIWVSLISVIAAVVLILAIGVPILCYLTNRKRESFESM